MILGQRQGVIRISCFICEWDSRARDQDWSTKQFPLRKSLKTYCIKNIRPQKDFSIPTTYKVGLDETICEKFLIYQKLNWKKGFLLGTIFVSWCSIPISKQQLQRKKRFDYHFKFLCKMKVPYYEFIVTNMIDKFQTLGCLMNLKIHFLYNHLDFFPENFSDANEELGIGTTKT